MPDWLYASWEAAYGADGARAIAESGLTQPPLDLSVKEDAEGWAEQLGGRLLEGGTIRLDDAAPVESLPGFAEGAWWVQDWAASLPARLLGDVKGLQVLDACAAPGGKTAQLAAAGAIVTALDQSERRLVRLNENLERLGLQAECVAQDLLKWKPGRLFDAILLDAPCTATGTLRRHPEMVWRVSSEDIGESAKLQARFLARAAGWLKPGGRIVYSVCSLQPQEGEQRVQAFLLSHPGFRLDQTASAPFAQGGQLRTHAGKAGAQGGMDGFYAACLIKLNDH
jgi:16S rRNA (cytosine967-C5)-methyltransferase